MSVSPFDNPLLSGLLGDDVVARHFAAEVELSAMLAFEVALAKAEAAEGIVPQSAADHIVERLNVFRPNIDRIRAATIRDGVVGVEFVRQLRDWLGAPNDQHVHFGATSQDLVDTALVLRLQPVLAELRRRLEGVVSRLGEIADRFGQRRLMARTRMQDALPITVADRIATWRAPLMRHLQRLEELKPRLLVVQFGGAAGTLDKLGERGPAVVARLAADLELGAPERAWHSQRDNIVELADWLSLVSGSLGKVGTDIGLMAQNSVGEITLAGGGGSSAMPHKSNPVGAEALVALGRFNATLTSGMHEALIHEQERSGAAWTLEWLLLPQMIMAGAASLRISATLFGQVLSIGKDL